MCSAMNSAKGLVLVLWAIDLVCVTSFKGFSSTSQNGLSFPSQNSNILKHPRFSNHKNLHQTTLFSEKTKEIVEINEKIVLKEEASILDDISLEEEDETEMQNKKFILPVLGLVAVAAGALFLGTNGQLSSLDFQLFLKESVDKIEALGPLGVVYFAALYTLAEVLALPATPLTISAGYLFGLVEGTAVVWVSALMASIIGFQLGRTLFREKILEIAGESPEFKAIDRAVGKEGLKLVLLLRLSPILPFSLANYLYGLTSVEFWPYFIGTAIGFLPGTIAYVYTGQVGKTLTGGDPTGLPPIAYIGILAGFVAVLKVVTDIAGNALEELQEEECE